MSLTPTTSGIVSETVTADQAPGAFWNAIATTDAVKQAIVDGVRDLIAGVHHADRETVLREAGVTAVDGTFASVATGLDLAPEHPRHQEALETVSRFGSEETIMGSVPLDAVAEGPVAILEAAEQTPTIGVRIDSAFRDRRRAHREQICELIATLSAVADVHVIATRITQRWLASEHREDLPGVSEWCNSGRDEPPLAATVDAATDALDVDGRKVAMLRQLEREPAETLSRHELASLHDISQSRLSQILRTDEASLAGLGLVDVFGPDGGQCVELLEAGHETLAAFDAELGRQIELDERFSESPNTHNRPCYPAHGMGGEDGGPYQTAYLSRADHHGAASCGTGSGCITLVDGPIQTAETTDTDRVRYVSYDADRDEAVIAVRATGALQHVVSAATALASPRLVDKALPEDRLESITLSESVLRDARCIGSLSDEALEDPSKLRDALVEWGEDLEELTTKLNHREYDDRDDFRSAIMRSAHGLAGSIVHLLDVVGVDIAREIRVPSGLNTNRLEGLTESIATAGAIQSRYGHYAAYRQLFEPREDKREQSITAEVDAEDPLGELIGNLVVRGPGVGRLRPLLEDRFSNDADIVEDAPEFAVNITVRDVSRADIATATARICSDKNLSLTRESVSTFHGLTASPHAAARALHQLESEDYRRDLRSDEARYGLSQLDATQLLPELASSVGKILKALLEATDPLTQSELAERADISTQTIRNHRETLEALGLLEITDAGYRLALSFQTSEERRKQVYPDAVDAELLIDVADALLVEYLSPAQYGDPEDPLGGILFDFPDDPQRPWSLADHDDLGPWLELGARLAGADRPEETIVTMGPAIEQQPLPTADTRTEVAG